MRRLCLIALLSAIAGAIVPGPVLADDVLKLAIGQRGNWENSVSELGQDAGFFRRHGVTLELLYTEGGGQTQQAVISGSVDIGIGVGTYGVIGAFGKGAPVRVIGNSMVGARDLYWYVPAASPVMSIKEAEGRSIAYSTTGSSTDLVVRGFQRVFNVKLKPVAAGSPASAFTQTMSGQIDIGWASPPFGVEAATSGRTRIIGRGSDVPDFADQSVRVMIANAGSLSRKSDAIGRYMDAYRETVAWLYSDLAALDAYAKWAGVTPALAKQVRDEFYPRANLEPDRIHGLDSLSQEAVGLKFLAAPLRPEQIVTLVQNKQAEKAP